MFVRNYFPIFFHALDFRVLYPRIITWEEFVQLHGESPICRVIGFEPERALPDGSFSFLFLHSQRFSNHHLCIKNPHAVQRGQKHKYVHNWIHICGRFRYPTRLYASGPLGAWGRCNIQCLVGCSGPPGWFGCWNQPRW